MVRSFRAKYAGALARIRYAGKKAYSSKVAARRRSAPARASKYLRGPSGFHMHMYRRYGQPISWSYAGDGSSVSNSQAVTFSLSDVQAANELTQLYDQYKICAVVVKIQLLNNPDQIYPPGSNPSTTTTNPTYHPKLWYYRDFDDSTPPSGLDVMREVGKAKCFTMNPNRTYTFKVKPAVLNLLSGTTTQPIWPKRLDCSASTQTHYGMKFVLDWNGTPPLNTAPIKLRIEKLYYLKMFNSR